MSAQQNKAKLRLLIEQGALPRSSCGQAFLKLLRPLLDSRALADERASGGRRLVVRDVSAAQRFLTARFPDADMIEAGFSRTRGVALFRDSKELGNNTPEVLAVRAWGSDALFRGERRISVVDATNEFGVFSFLLLEGANSYSIHGQCALVENLTVFACFEQMRLGIDLAFLTTGATAQERRTLPSIRTFKVGPQWFDSPLLLQWLRSAGQEHLGEAEARDTGDSPHRRRVSGCLPEWTWRRQVVQSHHRPRRRPKDFAQWQTWRRPTNRAC